MHVDINYSWLFPAGSLCERGSALIAIASPFPMPSATLASNIRHDHRSVPFTFKVLTLIHARQCSCRRQRRQRSRYGLFEFEMVRLERRPEIWTHNSHRSTPGIAGDSGTIGVSMVFVDEPREQ